MSYWDQEVRIGGDIDIKGGSPSGAEDSDLYSYGGNMRGIQEIEEESRRVGGKLVMGVGNTGWSMGQHLPLG